MRSVHNMPIVVEMNVKLMHTHFKGIEWVIYT